MIMTRIMELGWDVPPLARPRDYQGQAPVALYRGLTPDTLAKSRAVFGIEAPILDLDDELAPLSAERPAARSLAALLQ